MKREAGVGHWQAWSPRARACISPEEALRGGKAFPAQAGMPCPGAATTARLFGFCPRPTTQQGLGGRKMLCTVPRGQRHGAPGPSQAPAPMAATLRERLCCLCSLGYGLCHPSPKVRKMRVKRQVRVRGGPTRRANPQQGTSSGSHGEDALVGSGQKSTYLCKTKQNAYQGGESSNWLHSQ